MTVFIRSAESNDQPIIRALVREAGINPLHLHWPHFIVAQDASSVIACAQLRPHWDGSAELASLAVSPEYQGRGVGRALVCTLIHMGPPDLYLMCDAKMRPYYERFGFDVVGAADLPREMRALFRLGLMLTWAMRTLTRQPAKVLAMRRLTAQPQCGVGSFVRSSAFK